ncbi:MAG: energy transducer TonB [Proteobacteria bacterium]|nr:energy transducer TonB [Pseudomonadota bacterium]
MRRTLIFLVMSAFASAASAQDASVSENGLGPYHFGMTLAAAQATAPHAGWQVDTLAGTQALMGGPLLQVGADRFLASFVFDHDALQFVVLNGPTSSRCEEAVRARIEGELEPSFGAFNSSPGPRERGQLVSASITSLGSEIRDRTDANGRHVIYASRRRGMFIQVEGDPTPEGGCNLVLTFNAQLPYAGPLLAPVTFDELDRAQSLVNPQWISRPGVSAFERYYPEGARSSNIEGRTTLDCLVNMDGSLRCLVGYENPVGGGFGEAALHIAQDFRVLQSTTGVPAPGRRVRVPISFRLSSGPPPVGPSNE